jgi:hypothetical protein
MENIILIDNKKIISKIFYLSIFVAIIVIAPYFQNQLITGSIVNALLFISVVLLGVESAFLLCFLPSIISLFTGLLPFALAPVIPFIITGNVILVFIFYKLKNRNFWQASIISAFLKFAFIFSAGFILLKNVSLMISWPQLATAISGAAIAFLFLKTIKRI